MQKVLRNRVLPVFLVCLILFSTYIPASAAGFYDTDSADQWSTLFRNANYNATFLSAASEFFGTTASVDTMWHLMNTAINTTCGVGEVTQTKLEQGRIQLQSCFSQELQDTFFGQIVNNTESLRRMAAFAAMGLSTPSIEIRLHPSSGLYRLFDSANNLWIVRSDGSYPSFTLPPDMIPPTAQAVGGVLILSSPLPEAPPGGPPFSSGSTPPQPPPDPHVPVSLRPLSSPLVPAAPVVITAYFVPRS